MNNKTSRKVDDGLISRAVQSVRFQVPKTAAERVEAAIQQWETRCTWKTKASARKRYLLWYPAAAVIASMVLAALFIFQPFTSSDAQPAAPITEIRTELELKDKNIKIIWFQKKDFKLRRNES